MLKEENPHALSRSLTQGPEERMTIPEHIISQKLMDGRSPVDSYNKVFRFGYRQKQYFAKIYVQKVNFHRETYALENFGASGIPIPKIVYKSSSFGALQSCLVVTEQIKGRPLEQMQRHRHRYCYEAGRLIAKIHALKIAAIARPLILPIEKIVKDLAEFAADEQISHPLLRSIDKFLEEVCTSNHVVMSHGDFTWRHVFGSRGTISGIIDWESLRTARPEFDLGHARALIETLGGAEEEQHFVKGYNLTFNEDLARKLKFYYTVLFAHHWKKTNRQQRYEKALRTLKAQST